MSFSSPQVESRTEFSPLPQQEDDQTYNTNFHVNTIINNRRILIEPIEERFDWDSLVIMLRLALVGTLLVGLSLRETKLNQPSSIPIPPKFFLDTFHIPQIKISDGELSSIWNITLTVSNVMNATNINILRLDAAICYKENQTLALETPIMPQYALQSQVFPMEGEETKKVHLKLKTTGWEKDQPIVDDVVIDAIAQDMQRGVTRFSLHLRVVGEVESSDGWVAPFIMYPKCNNLRVKFVEGNEKGESATMIDSNSRECVGLVEWEEDKSNNHYRN